MNETFEECTLKLTLLNTSYWSYKDVGIYFGCSPSKAYKILHEAKKHSQPAPFFSGLTKRDAILAACGLNLADEIKDLSNRSILLKGTEFSPKEKKDVH